MNNEKMKENILEYASYLRKMKCELTEKIIKNLPCIDPKFEEKKFIQNLSSYIENIFEKHLENLLKPVRENFEQNPEYFY